MCKVMKVNLSSYYHWIKAGCVIKKTDKKVNELIEVIFIQGRLNYGTRRIQDKILELYGLIISRKRIASIMKDMNLKVKMKRRYKNITDSNHNLPIAANILNRDFYASNPDEKYVGDKNINKNIFNICFFNVKYIPTGEG
ncbi:MAG: transposase [Campylobacteraceae bacterium]|nr:transposase [Campylobacteraceae bacterium]